MICTLLVISRIQSIRKLLEELSSRSKAFKRRQADLSPFFRARSVLNIKHYKTAHLFFGSFDFGTFLQISLGKLKHGPDAALVW